MKNTIYHVVISYRKGSDDEFEHLATTDLTEARECAADELYYAQRDKVYDKIVEIRIYDDEDEQTDYNTISIFDRFRVSALWDDGSNVDNDLVDIGKMDGSDAKTAVEKELAEARAWFEEDGDSSEEPPAYYLVSCYIDGRNVYEEKVVQ